ncbi:MAG: protein translocase subunit SecD [Candidatus Nanoarchaeia archaeon]
MRNKWLILVILIIVGLAIYIDMPEARISLTKIGLSYERDFKLLFGLDLKGGAHLVYEADMSKIEKKDWDAALNGLKEVIERRVNLLGVTEPIIQTSRVGETYRVIVELPGVFDTTKAIETIGKTAQLNFKEQGKKEGEWKDTGLTGKDFKKATVQINPNTTEYEISIEFNAKGAKLFADITKRNLHKPVAIFLDEELISAPVVQAVINDGKAVITGKFTRESARQLAVQLNAGALPVPVKLISQMNIGATLGRDTIEKSLLAGIIGIILVAIFMIVYYRLPGFLAVIALGLYAVITIALFKLIPVTLTLAGIAGFILSIGMAVDANILIFERMREELRAGRTLGLAIEDGFRRAWSSIRDSNVSSLITCFILFYFGSGIIRGFAVTLSLGIIVSMFTAITITRTLLNLVTATSIGRKEWFYGVETLTPKSKSSNF